MRGTAVPLIAARVVGMAAQQTGSGGRQACPWLVCGRGKLGWYGELMAWSAMLAPFQVRSFRFQFPADLATSWGIEMENLVLGWYNRALGSSCDAR